MTSQPLTPWRVALLVMALMVAYALSFVDRQILALLVQPMQASLGISDTGFGILQGLAFALFYFSFGIPLGRMADRGNRRNLIAIAILLWSVMTMACGTAHSFVALFIWRAGVGIGEAALSPAAYSMIADSVPKNRLSFVMALYSMGVHIGSGMALVLGGTLLNWIDASGASGWFGTPIEPWRLVFMIVGAPGIALAAIFLLLREPPRRHVGPAVEHMPTLRETVALVVNERRLFAGLILGFAFHNGTLNALLAWMPTFLERAYGQSPGQFGAMLGVATMGGGVLGLLAGGLVSDRMVASGRSDTPIVVGLAAVTGAFLSGLGAIYGGSPTLSIFFYGCAMFSLALPIGTIAAALQFIVPNRYRAQVSALYLISISIAGMTLGPGLPPLISDMIFRDPFRIGDGLALTLAGMATLSISFMITGRAAYARRYSSIHHAPLQQGQTS
jgi:MFS family permease